MHACMHVLPSEDGIVYNVYNNVYNDVYVRGFWIKKIS